MMMATKSLFVVLAVVTLAVLQLEHAKAGIRDWDCDQVQQWVETVGLGKYAATLQANDIDGFVLASDLLHVNEWQAIGIASVGDVVRLRAAVRQRLAQEGGMAQASPAQPTAPAPAPAPSPAPAPAQVPISQPKLVRRHTRDSSSTSSTSSTSISSSAATDDVPWSTVASPWIGFARRWDVLSSPYQDTVTKLRAFLPNLRYTKTLSPAPPSPDRLAAGPEQKAFYEYYLPRVQLTRGMPWNLAQHELRKADPGASLETLTRRWLDGNAPAMTGWTHAAILHIVAMNAIGPSFGGMGVGDMSPFSRNNCIMFTINMMRDHRDRLLHLVEIGALPGTAAVMEAISNTTEIIKQRLAETPNPEHHVGFPEDVSHEDLVNSTMFIPSSVVMEKLGRHLSRLLYMPPDPPVAELPFELQYPLNPDIDWAVLEQAYLMGDPHALYFDNFLRPEALANIRQFCMQATVYYDMKMTYQGAYFQTGFGNRVMFRIVEELRHALPRVLGGLTVWEMWSYKYGDSSLGINKHIDSAIVNFNFWITPDESNLNASSGGLIVYKVKPSEKQRHYEVNSALGGLLLDDFVANMTEDQILRVPHRQNRVVVFDSALVHQSDRFNFRPGYKNRRINFTILFGQNAWSADVAGDMEIAGLVNDGAMYTTKALPPAAASAS